MATIVFVDHLGEESLGIMQLSAVLKQQRHQTHLACGSLEAISTTIARVKPDLLGYSCYMADYDWYLDKARQLKASFPGIPNIFGGYAPSDGGHLFVDTAIDMLCRGDGEEVMLKVAQRLDNRDNNFEGLGLSLRGDDHTTAPVHRIENIDTLPFPDRALFGYGTKHKFSFLTISARGCSFCCSFCSNVMGIMRAKNRTTYVRYHSVDYMIAELKHIKSNYRVSYFEFVDSTFNLDETRMLEFLERYNREIDLPFNCCVRADLVTYGEGRTDHVAFWLGAGRILHSTSREGLGVVEEPEPKELQNRRRRVVRL